MVEGLSGVLWALITVAMVAVLGAAVAYGIVQRRQRRPPPDRQAEERRAREMVGRE